MKQGTWIALSEIGIEDHADFSNFIKLLNQDNIIWRTISFREQIEKFKLEQNYRIIKKLQRKVQNQRN